MSEEMKNLNDQQPEETKAPVEEKTEAPKLPFNLSKKNLAIICGAVAAALVLVLVLVLTLGGGNDPHTHSFENGKCACGESDPNYVPPHTHSFVEGKCECGATDPNYVPPHTHSFVEGKCECGATDPNYVPPHTHTFVEGKCECGETDPNYVPEATNEYTLGLGIVFGDITNAQINATIATVVLDSNGVIVAAKLDAVQNKFSCTADGIVFSNLLTKKELGFNYNMAAYGTPNWGTTVKEWFEQAAIFEQYVIGKTAAELEALEYQEVNNHLISKDEALLNAGCTIQIGEFVDAVVKACNDEQATTFTTDGEIVLGLGINSADNGSDGDDFEATVKMNIDYAAVVTVDGVIVAALNDASQPQATIEDGDVISTAKLISKRELKEGYNMAAFGSDNNGDGIVLEWYVQSAAFSKYIVGKTPAQVAKLETALVNGHYISTDNVLLSAGCTMQITGIMDVVAEACGYVPSAEKEYTLGLGIVYGDITSSQINATIATVVVDGNGVIVAVKIDAVQNKYTITDTIVFSNLLTKKELGYNYNMAAFGTSLVGNPTVKEWFEQAAAFEAWCVGKTIAEVAAMETQTMSNGYVISADEALLSAGCTISITDFVAAVVKAGNDEQATTFTTDGEIVLGLGINSADNGSTGDDFEATVKMNIDYAAVVTVDGVIVAALNDASQPQATIEDGEVTATAKLISKRELKEGYNMAAYGSDNNGDGIVLEWYLQSAAFSKYIVGLTPAQVAKLETALVNGHYISTDNVLLSAGCTMQITGIMDVVAEACDYVPSAEKEYTLGLGIVYGDITNQQINATIATVVLDENGVIVAVKLDAVQNKFSCTENGIVFSNLLTKKELGFNYNMAAYGSSLVGNATVKEWFEQAAAFEAWCVGKTIAEVAAMETQTMSNGYVISADEALLSAGCTISITDFVAAVVKAGNDEQATTFTTDGEIVLGLGINSADNGSDGDDFEATVKMNIDYAAVVTVDGVIVAALNDASQPQATIEDGEVTATAKLISKRELKEGYNMAAYGSDNNGDGIVLEWYLQSAAFSNYLVGLTAEQVENLETTEVNNHFISTDDVLLSAGCTMQITGIMDVVVEACGDAA